LKKQKKKSSIAASKMLRTISLNICYYFVFAAVANANPVISEFMADNQSTLADEDGTYSDWIEIHNPTAAAINLSGWKLTDSASNLSKWSFPAITLQPGEFKIFFASDKAATRSNHTNFRLSAGGEYLALVKPDGSIQQQFLPTFPSQAADESYGVRFQSTTLVAKGAATRYKVPTGTVSNWQTTSFSHTSWLQGGSGLGFGLTEPGITVRHVFKNGTIGGLADAESLLALPAGNSAILSTTTITAGTVNFLGDGGDGNYAFNTSPPGGAGEQYAIEATGFISIATAGFYTFGLNSDDGGSIKIDNTDVMIDDSFHGPEDHMGSINLTAGTHSFRVVMFEGGGGDELEFYAASGQLTSWNSTAFRLVGDTANGGLPATTLPQGVGGIFATNLQTAMSGRNSAYFRTPFVSTGPSTATTMSLVMRSNDGFSAWLNGTAVASQNSLASPAWNSTATASKSNAESLRRQAWNVTSSLSSLINGNNLLAIQGMNISSSDSSFLVLPELIMGSWDQTQTPVFYGSSLATPGWINGDFSLLGKVSDTQFSVKRGIFNAPFLLTITTLTPGATIRYTTDGSSPTATNGTIYTEPLTISSTTNLRAAAFIPGWEPTDIDTQTFLFPNDIILQQANGSPPTGWPVNSGTDQVLDFGMDPDIVNNSNPNIGGATSVKNALLALPSVVITTDLSNYFNINGSQGFFSNPYGRGFAWEKPISLEWINPPDALNPNGTSEFQVNAGVRMRGGFSRDPNNPKHAFHVYFREDYGEKKLIYPLFGRHGTQEFDQIDFRTSQNYSWSYQADGNNTFLREEATRMAQTDMGQPGSKVRYVHLYLNGTYWGLFNLDERKEAAFSASYMGGNKDEYDVIKGEQDSGYTTGVTDGTLAAWQSLWNLSRAHQANPTNANYFKMMGKAADGVTATTDPVLLDDDNLIDYLLLTFWSGNLDGCMSAFLGNERANNWFGSRRAINNTGDGFRFFAHDFEHSFFDVNEDRTGPFTPSSQADFTYSNPYYLHLDLIGNAEYRMRWADQVQKHMFQNGALTSASWSNRINQLATIVDQSIIAESARWGDAKRNEPFTKDDWINAQNSLLSYLTPRQSIVLQQLRDDGLYPSTDAPQVIPSGGYQSTGTKVTMTGPASTTLYYMTDGSDPRAIGGAIKSGAQVFTSSTTSETLIPWGAGNWKYLSNNSNQGTAWRATSFTDTSWTTGTAELGYGDGDEATAITKPTPPYATTYFRKSFTVTNPQQISNLTMDVEYDDAYAVYLNGTRIAGNLPQNSAFNYFSGDAIEDTQETINSISSALLLSGTNVIAVEIHQANNSSSDISMNLSLAATRANTSTPITLTGNGEKHIRARAYQSTTSTWSALVDAAFFVDTSAPVPQNLAISEIMYHPADPSPAEITAGHTSASDFEYLEILNTGTSNIDLRGLYIYDAVRFDFDDSELGTTLAPNARIIIASKKTAFLMRYGSGLPLAGSFSGNLSDSGETITIQAANDAIIRRVSYQDVNGWPAEADGTGASLVLIAPSEFATENAATSWRSSVTKTGNPGTSDALTLAAWMLSAGQSNANTDPDNDGMNNLLEYALGGNPIIADAHLLPKIKFQTYALPNTPGTYAVLEHNLRFATDDLVITWESTNSLTAAWTTDDVVLVSNTRSSPTSNALLHRSPTPVDSHLKKFWRLRVNLRP
jgi:hypothetical protein